MSQRHSPQYSTERFHVAATAHVHSFTIDNEHEPARAELSGASITTGTPGSNDRKRRKVTYVTTVSLGVDRQLSHVVSVALAMQKRKV